MRSLSAALALLVVGLAGAVVACGSGEPAARQPVEALPPLDLESLDPEVAEAIRRLQSAIERPGERPDLEPDRDDLARDPAELHQVLAEVLHAHELFAAAVVSYRNAELLDRPPTSEPPTVAEAARRAYLTGQALRSLGRLEAALVELRRADELLLESRTSLPVPHAAALLAVGQTLQDLGWPDEAQAALERALRLSPALALAHFHLAQLAAEAGAVDEAIDRYRRVLDLQPEASVVELPLATTLRAAGDAEGAEIHLARRGDGRIRLDDPWMAEIEARGLGASRSLEVGSKAFAAGRYEEAAASFARAAEARPDDATAHLNLGSALARLGRVDEARTSLERAAELAPGEARPHFNLGALASAAGDLDAALAHYDRALSIEPSYPSASFNRAGLLLRVGRFADAAEAFEQTVRLAPSNVQARIGHVVALGRAGRTTEQLEAARRHVDELPSARAPREALARVLAASADPALRDGRAALELLQLDGALDPAAALDLGTAEATAMAHAASGDYEQAVAWQARALDAVRGSGREDLVPPAEAALARYRDGRPAPSPWYGEAFGAVW